MASLAEEISLLISAVKYVSYPNRHLKVAIALVSCETAKLNARNNSKANTVLVERNLRLITFRLPTICHF